MQEHVHEGSCTAKTVAIMKVSIRTANTGIYVTLSAIQAGCARRRRREP